MSALGRRARPRKGELLPRSHLSVTRRCPCITLTRLPLPSGCVAMVSFSPVRFPPPLPAGTAPSCSICSVASGDRWTFPVPTLDVIAPERPAGEGGLQLTQPCQAHRQETSYVSWAGPEHHTSYFMLGGEDTAEQTLHSSYATQPPRINLREVCPSPGDPILGHLRWKSEPTALSKGNSVMVLVKR